MPETPVFLLAFANDREHSAQYLRNLPEELRQITEALDRAKEHGLCDYVYLANATLKQILDTFQKAEYRNRIAVFHYGGHANSLQLLLETSDGRVATADARGLAAFLSQQRGLELVFLNGCSTRQQVAALLDANVPMVIATSQAINDQVAMEFSSRFYHGLVSGINVHTAYREAEAAARVQGDGNVRHLYWAGAQEAVANIQEDRWPWELHFKKGAESEGQWNLPDAVGNPLFGIPELTPVDLPAEPFRHLSWFTRADAEIFFGRNYQVRQLYDRIKEPDAAHIVLLYGQAGVGKSSLLDAGLLPRLEGSDETLYLRRNQQLGLLETARQGLGLTANGDLSLGSAWRAREEKNHLPLVLILDQVEEIFTRPGNNPADELKEFLESLAETFALPEARPQGRLILGFRKEWESEIEQKLKEYKLPHAKLFLEPLDSRGIIQAIVGVTKSRRLQTHYGLGIEDDLPQHIADDLSSDPNSPIAPTLQILLTKMWAEAKRRNNSKPTFDTELYLELKKQGILLGDFLDQQLAKLKESQPEVVAAGLALDILAYHTTPLGTAEQRTEAQVKEQYQHRLPVLPQLLDKLKELYLLSDPPQDQPNEGAAKATRLAHDTLAPPVRARYDRSVFPGQRARRILENRVSEWADNQTGTPLDERDLSSVELGAPGMRNWTEDEKRLIESSRHARKRRTVQRRVLQGAVVTAIIIVAVLSLIAFRQRQQARAAEQQALSRQLLAQANLLRSSPLSASFIQSILLDVEAQKRFSSSESNQELGTALGLLPMQAARLDFGGPIKKLEFSPDGRYLAVLQANELQVRELTPGQSDQAKIRFSTKAACHSVAFSSDGSLLAAACGREESGPRTVIVWDWLQNQQVVKLDFPSEAFVDSFIESTHKLIVRDSKTLKVLEIEKNRSTEVRSIDLSQFEARYATYGAAVSPGGRYFALATSDTAERGVVKVFDLTTGQETYNSATTDKEGDTQRSIAISHDGKMLTLGRAFPVDAIQGDSLRIVDTVARADVIVELTGFASELIISPDGKYLAVRDDNQGSFRIFDSGGRDVVVPIDNDTQNLGERAGMFFSPDAERLMLYNGKSAARFFRIPYTYKTERRVVAQELLRMAPEFPIRIAALSPDGQYFIAGSESGSLVIWRTSSVLEQSRVSRSYQPPYFTMDESTGLNYFNDSFFSPKGGYIILDSQNTSYIIDAKEGREVMRSETATQIIVFSKDDAYVSLSGEEKGTVIRELATGREFRLAPDGQVVRSLVVSPQRSSLFVTSEIIREIDLKSGKISPLMETSPPSTGTISPDGQYILMSDGAAQDIITIESGKKVRLTDALKGKCGMTFSETGKYVAGCLDEKTLNIWEAATGKLVDTITLPSDSLNQGGVKIKFDSADRLLAISTATKVQITDLQTKQTIMSGGDFGVVYSIDFSPDLKHVLIHVEGNMVQVRSLPEDIEISRIKGDLEISKARFSADGKYLVLLENDIYQFTTPMGGTNIIKGINVRSMLWRTSDLTGNVCQWLPRNLTQDEWSKYLGATLYVKMCPDLP